MLTTSSDAKTNTIDFQPMFVIHFAEPENKNKKTDMSR